VQRDSGCPEEQRRSPRAVPILVRLPHRLIRSKPNCDSYSVLYRSAAKLFRDLAQARADGSLGRLLESIALTDVLLVDDFAMASLSDDERPSFLEVCDDRYGRRSTVLTSQLPVDSWHAQIGDPTIADSILDRLVHNAYPCRLFWPSLMGVTGEPATDQQRNYRINY
jgi:DNA replication protein DnaC